MAAITNIASTGNERVADAAHVGVPTVLTVALVVAVTFVLGGLTSGLVVGAVFVAGIAAVRLAGRSIAPDEFAALSALHATAAVVLALAV